MNDSTKLHAINFTHRFIGHEQEEHYMTDMTVRDLTDAVGNMCYRGKATTSLIQSFFACDSEEQPDSQTLYFALESVLMELSDIKNTVEAYARTNRQT